MVGAASGSLGFAAQGIQAEARARMTDTIARGTLLRRAASGVAAAVAGGVAVGVLPRVAGSAPSAAQDDRVLALALGLEQAQQALYEAADAAGILDGDLAEFVATALEQEAVHVRSVATLAGGGGAPPSFDFADAVADPDRFSSTAIRLENITIPGLQRPGRQPHADAPGGVGACDLGGRAPRRVDAGIVGDRPAGQAVDAGASAEDHPGGAGIPRHRPGSHSVSGRRAAGLIDAARLDPAGALAGAADGCSRGGFIAMAGAGALALALPAAASAKDAAADDRRS